MSQIDKIIYIPVLFWFIILISILYFIVFSYFLTVFLTILKIRVLYFNDLIKLCNNNIKNAFLILLLHNLLWLNYNIYSNLLNLSNKIKY